MRLADSLLFLHSDEKYSCLCYNKVKESLCLEIKSKLHLRKGLNLPIQKKASNITESFSKRKTLSCMPSYLANKKKLLESQNPTITNIEVFLDLPFFKHHIQLFSNYDEPYFKVLYDRVVSEPIDLSKVQLEAVMTIPKFNSSGYRAYSVRIRLPKRDRKESLKATRICCVLTEYENNKGLNAGFLHTIGIYLKGSKDYREFCSNNKIGEDVKLAEKIIEMSGSSTFMDALKDISNGMA